MKPILRSSAVAIAIGLATLVVGLADVSDGALIESAFDTFTKGVGTIGDIATKPVDVLTDTAKSVGSMASNAVTDSLSTVANAGQQVRNMATGAVDSAAQGVGGAVDGVVGGVRSMTTKAIDNTVGPVADAARGMANFVTGGGRGSGDRAKRSKNDISFGGLVRALGSALVETVKHPTRIVTEARPLFDEFREYVTDSSTALSGSWRQVPRFLSWLQKSMPLV